MTIVSSAPGKAVLLGEYAVLEGAPALSVATNRRARVVLQPLPGRRCEVHAPEVGAEHVELFLDADGLPDWRGHTEVAQRLSLLEQTIRGLAAEGLHLSPGRGFRLRLDTAAFFDQVGAERLKLGLGSSAALTVALATALAMHAGRGAASADRRVWLESLLRLHRGFQSGQGSGVDVATSLVGGVVLYQLLDRGSQPEARDAHWPAGLHKLFVWSGRSASTPQFLARLSQWRGHHEADYAAHMNELIAIANTAAEAVRANQAAAVVQAAGRYASALQALGRASGVDIVSAEHARIGAIARTAGVLYKSCGAGGGDIGVALDLDPERLEQLRARLAENGFSCVPLSVDEHGLQLELQELEMDAA